MLAPVRASDRAFFTKALLTKTADVCHNGAIVLETVLLDTTRPVSLEAKIVALTAEVLSRDDLFVVGVSVRGAKGSRLIEVYVDGDQGVTVSDLAKISRNLAFALDSDDLIPGKYLLNVSTPGEDRSLLLERQYVRHVGKVLQIQLVHEDGSNRIEGENLGMSDGVLRLKISDSEIIELPLNTISKAKIKLPW